jgi:methionyl-tRNA formyltransferase
MPQSNGTNIRIIFMGTPEFAVASLDALVKSGHNIVGVITAPDKPAGRGMKMNESAVKKYATANGLRVLQPPKLKDPLFIEELRSLQADLQIVVAFRMLPEIIWNMPVMGTINVHASLLPKYRGAAPINWAIINGEQISGVTTFKLTHEIDTGNILLQKKITIHDKDTAGDLHDKLKDLGAELLIETIDGLFDGKLHEQPQDLNIPTVHAPKLFTETCRIDWNKSVDEVYNLIRGLAPFPGAFTELNGKIFKIYRADKYNTLNSALPGELETDNKTYLRFACADGYIYAKEIQAEGKRKMQIEEFLRGFREKA